MGAGAKLLVLVDGEHHPAAVRDALEAIRVGGRDVVAAVFCGGAEKVDVDALDLAYGIPVVRPGGAGGVPPHVGDLSGALVQAIDRFAPDAILDLTDEPVLSPDDRFRLASVALGRGVPFGGADFELRPPRFADVLTKPSVRVFATGKRTGKTAIASAFAKHAVSRGHTPIIVAVGRGGPNPPRLIEAGAVLSPDVLIGLVDAGHHASSDYVEDALTSGVTTIGCVRVGGGLAGATVSSNVHAAAKIAEERHEDLVILEGSGASVPEVAARAGIICVPAYLGAAVGTYLNPYRLLLADLAVVTMAEQGSAAAQTQSQILGSVPDLDVLQVVFRPQPLTDVGGRKAFLCTTAPRDAGSVLKAHLEHVHGCEVVGMTHHLSDRPALRRDIENAADHDVLLVELKAAAVDVAVRAALANGTDVVFVNNVPVDAATGEASDAIREAFDRVLDRARSAP